MSLFNLVQPNDGIRPVSGVQELPRDFGELFDASEEAVKLNFNSDSAVTSFDQALDEGFNELYTEATGNKAYSLMQRPSLTAEEYGRYGDKYPRAIMRDRGAMMVEVDRLREANPEQFANVPRWDEVFNRSKQIAQQASIEQQKAMLYNKSNWSGFSNFLGSTFGALQDPVAVVSMLATAPLPLGLVAGGVRTAMLAEGLLAFTAEAAFIQPQVLEWQAQLEKTYGDQHEDYTIGDAIATVAAVTLGTVALTGAFVGASKWYQNALDVSVDTLVPESHRLMPPAKALPAPDSPIVIGGRPGISPDEVRKLADDIAMGKRPQPGEGKKFLAVDQDVWHSVLWQRAKSIGVRLNDTDAAMRFLVKEMLDQVGGLEEIQKVAARLSPVGHVPRPLNIIQQQLLKAERGLNHKIKQITEIQPIHALPDDPLARMKAILRMEENEAARLKALEDKIPGLRQTVTRLENELARHHEREQVEGLIKTLEKGEMPNAWVPLAADILKSVKRFDQLVRKAEKLPPSRPALTNGARVMEGFLYRGDDGIMNFVTPATLVKQVEADELQAQRFKDSAEEAIADLDIDGDMKIPMPDGKETTVKAFKATIKRAAQKAKSIGVCMR